MHSINEMHHFGPWHHGLGHLYVDRRMPLWMWPLNDLKASLLQCANQFCFKRQVQGLSRKYWRCQYMSDISDITKTAIGHCWSNKPIPNCHIDPYCGRYFQPSLSHHRWRGRRLAKLKCHVCGANGPGLVLTTLLSNIKTRFRQDVHQS